MAIGRYLVMIASCLFPAFTFAATAWQIIPEGSTLSFTAIQNGAPVKGEFRKFSGEILFSPDDLTHSRVEMTVDTASVTASYQDITATLLTEDWLSPSIFPQARFTAEKFTREGDIYHAQGQLAVRDKTHPCAVSFTLKEYAENKAVAVGHTTVKRTAFGVGQGQWSDTGTIKDEVEIHFTIQARAD